MTLEDDTRQPSIQAMASPAAERESPRRSRNTHTHSLGGLSTAGPASTTKRSYVLQFSATNSLILDRIQGRSKKSDFEVAVPSISVFKGGNHSSSGPVKAAHNLSDTLMMPTEVPVATPSFSAAASPESSILDSITVGGKRKRDSTAEDVDFSQTTIAFPWVGLPNPVPKPELQHSERLQTCSKCEGQLHSREVYLITCSWCLNSWHLQCHSPPVTNTTPSSEFVCTNCVAQQEEAARLKGKATLQRQHEVERLRRKRLATLPQGVAPAKPGLVGFGPGRAPDSSRTEYFSNKNRVDLLNVLSLCDQLKPQLLTDILVSVSKKHPVLPLFDSPDWEALLPSAQRPAKGTPGDKPRHGHTVHGSKAKIKARATKKILKRTRVIEVVTDAPGLDDDVLPSTWTKAGEGMYDKITHDTEDRSFLMDDNDEEAFSHFMVDAFGKQIVEAVGG